MGVAQSHIEAEITFNYVSQPEVMRTIQITSQGVRSGNVQEKMYAQTAGIGMQPKRIRDIRVQMIETQGVNQGTMSRALESLFLTMQSKFRFTNTHLLMDIPPTEFDEDEEFEYMFPILDQENLINVQYVSTEEGGEGAHELLHVFEWECWTSRDQPSAVRLVGVINSKLQHIFSRNDPALEVRVNKQYYFY